MLFWTFNQCREFSAGVPWVRRGQGKVSTKRLPITVLTDASEVLSSGALPCTVMLSALLPIVSAKFSRARWSTSTTTPF
jgi:hypothetical protein